MNWIYSSDSEQAFLIEGFRQLNIELTPSTPSLPLTHYFMPFSQLSFSSPTASLVSRSISQQDEARPNTFHTLDKSEYLDVDISTTYNLDLSHRTVSALSYACFQNSILCLDAGVRVSLMRNMAIINRRLKSGSLHINPASGELCLTLCFSFGETNAIRYSQMGLKSKLSMMLEIIRDQWKIILPTLMPKYFEAEWRQMEDTSGYTGMETDRLKALGFNIKHAHIEHPSGFQSEYCSEDKVRSNQNLKRLGQFEQAKRMSNSKYLQLSKLIPLLSEFASKDQQDLLRYHWEIFYDWETIRTACDKMDLRKMQAKNCIYTKIELRQVKSQQPLQKSRFSDIRLVSAVAKKEEDLGWTSNLLVKKTTEPVRLHNQRAVLQAIGSEKCLFIARYYNAQMMPDCLLLQYCPLATMDKYLSQNRKVVSLDTKIFLFYQLANGLRFLRDQGIVHNDVKPQNVLLKVLTDRSKRMSTFIVRLIDFGESSFIGLADTHKKGFTHPYASPEKLRSQSTSQRSDVYSLGVIMYELIFESYPTELLKKKPYPDSPVYLRYFTIAPEKCRYYGHRHIYQLLFWLCLKCLDPDPALRPCLNWYCKIMKDLLDLIEVAAQ